MDKQKRAEINHCIIGIKNRDNESLKRLYALMGHSIRYIALKFMQDIKDAEDLEQDFWANIYNISDKYNYISNGFGYLTKIMTHMALNKFGKLNGEKKHVVEVVDYNKICSFDENEVIDRLDDQTAVQRAIDRLDATEKIIMQLTLFEDKTISQISKELKISKSRVGRIKLAAREKLKNELSEYVLGKK